MNIKKLIGQHLTPFALSLSKRDIMSFDKLRTNGMYYLIIFLIFIIVVERTLTGMLTEPLQRFWEHRMGKPLKRFDQTG